jgi:predicted Zn finger-like uncharacterized protein
MFTVCPKCALTLVVTAADLRIAQGYVRCGRCLDVFNALARLSEERPGATPTPVPEEGAQPAEGGPPPEGTPPADGGPPAFEPSATPSPPSAADDTGEIDIELDASILEISARPPAPPATVETEAHAPAAQPPAAQPPAAQPPAAQPPAAALSPKSATVSRPTEPPRPAAEPQAQRTQESSAASIEAVRAQLTNSAQEAAQETSDETSGQVAWRSRSGLAWRLGSGALALVLMLQIVNHYRDALAANSALGGPLRAVYSALGVKLAPRWNIRAYDVRQLGASVDGATPGEIVVRASVMNSATHPQPLPLLRVTLQDRFGNRIAARDVPPRDYLPSSVAPSAPLAAGSRVDATMVFVDPGPQAVGFEIDACLPIRGAQAGRDRAAAVACAHGP